MMLSPDLTYPSTTPVAALKPPSFVSLSFIFSIAFIEVRSYPCATVKTTASSPSVNRMRPEPPPERTAPR